MATAGLFLRSPLLPALPERETEPGIISGAHRVLLNGTELSLHLASEAMFGAGWGFGFVGFFFFPLPPLPSSLL